MPSITRHPPPALLLAGLTALLAFGTRVLLHTDALQLTHPCSFYCMFLYKYDSDASQASLFALLAAILISPLFKHFGKFAEFAGRHVWQVSVLTGVLLALGTHVVYHTHPVSMDEYMERFQSQIFAHGSLTGRYPPGWIGRLIPLPFQNFFETISYPTGAVLSGYWPGFALTMTPFTLLGASWLCNPVLAAASVAAIAHTCRILFPDDKETAGWAMLFTIASSAFVGMAISYFAMTGILLANLVFTWGMLRPTSWGLFRSGVAGSIALTFHQPVSHILFALPWLLWFLYRRPSARQIAILAAGYSPLCMALGIGWVLLKAHIAGPAAHQGMSSGSAVVDIQHVFSLPSYWIVRLRIADFLKIALWAVPGLVVLACMGASRKRDNIGAQLLAASAVFTFLGYLFVPFDQGNGWGDRYFHPAWSVLPILAAAGLGVQMRFDDYGSFLKLRNLAGALIVSGALVLLPFQLWQMEHQIHTELADFPDIPAGRQGVIFIPIVKGYSMDMIQNDPFLRGPVIRMVSVNDASDAAFLRAAGINATLFPTQSSERIWLLPASSGATTPSGVLDSRE